MNFTRIFLAVTLAGASVLPAGRADGQVLSWNIAGPGTLSSSASGTQSTLGYNLDRGWDYSTKNWSVTAIAPSAGDYAFSWDYSGYHAYYMTYAELDAGNNTQGTSTNLFAGGVAGGFDVAGSYTFTGVNAGDELQWSMAGTNYDSDNRLIGTLSLDQTSAVTATPEPASLALLGTGLLGVIGVARRRRATTAA